MDKRPGPQIKTRLSQTTSYAVREKLLDAIEAKRPKGGIAALAGDVLGRSHGKASVYALLYRQPKKEWPKERCLAIDDAMFFIERAYRIGVLAVDEVEDLHRLISKGSPRMVLDARGTFYRALGSALSTSLRTAIAHDLQNIRRASLDAIERTLERELRLIEVPAEAGLHATYARYFRGVLQRASLPS